MDHISTRRYAQLVREWGTGIGWRAEDYGTHSLRHTKASIIYVTRKTALVRAWLAHMPHYHVHFTPTSASWINQVERWFAALTRKQLRRDVHTSTSQLEQDIRAFIERHNENPKPYRWTESADEILASVKRYCQNRRLHIMLRSFRFR